jgi:hypothetical protein
VLLEPASVYLYHVQWSPFRPLVMAASTGDGRIALYDLLASKQHPAKVPHAPPTPPVAPRMRRTRLVTCQRSTRSTRVSVQ